MMKCPLLPPAECLAEGCGWWDTNGDRCAVLGIAVSLEKMNYNVLGIAVSLEEMITMTQARDNIDIED